MGETLPNTRLQLRRTVVLVGMPGAGKSAVGRALAAELGVDLRDSDTAIVERARLAIDEIFAKHGEAFFREKEAQVIQSLLVGPPCVLSTGGGAWLNPQTRAALAGAAAVVWLKADLELLWSRVRHRDTRPLLRTVDPKATLSELKVAREPAYARAEFTLDILPDWSVASTCAALMDLLQDAGVIETGPP